MPHTVLTLALAIALALAASAPQAAAVPPPAADAPASPVRAAGVPVEPGPRGTVRNVRGLSIEVIGRGRPVLMIPGLNSHADTWRGTCAALQAERVQCHLVTLPGFAGQPAAADASPFLASMRDRLLAYVDEAKLERPVIVGHSLGGVLALQMAIARPAVAERLVVVDSLPFMPAAMNPAATVDSARPMAEATREAMTQSTDEAFYAQADAAIQGMAQAPARTAQIRAWGRASDRRVTTDAMVELMTTDLRGELAAIKVPTLVLGAWAAYKPYGATKESTAGIFRTQFAALPGVRLEMSEGGYHFLMWDDPSWVQSQARDFIAAR